MNGASSFLDWEMRAIARLEPERIGQEARIPVDRTRLYNGSSSDRLGQTT